MEEHENVVECRRYGQYLDVLDPKIAIANPWTPPGGLTNEMLLEAIEEIQRHTRVKGFGIASYDPECDRNQNALNAACSAAESILSRASSRGGGRPRPL